ncbi:hypothetical protein Tco_1071566, partial [Tanacetum coccineum]
EVGFKEYEIGVLKSEFEKVKQEEEGIDFKIAKFDNASKDLDKLLASQITDNSKKGLGYHVVPPPHPLSLNAPAKLDLSYSGLDEFKQPEFKGYGPQDSKLESTIDCNKESDNSKENTDDSLEKEQVSDSEYSFVESSPNVVKETIFHTAKKVEFVKPKNNEKSVTKTVRYAEMYRSQSPRGNQRSWNGQKSNQLGSEFVMSNKACFICGSFNHLQNNCTHHQKKRVVSGNNYNRVDYDYYTKTSHLRTHKNMTSRAVLLKSGLKPLSTARPIYTAHSKPTVHRNPQMNNIGFADSGNAQGYMMFPDESQILLKIPREDNMYSFDMKNIVPKDSLTCLATKATLDESMLWHRRLEKNVIRREYSIARTPQQNGVAKRRNRT